MKFVDNVLGGIGEAKVLWKEWNIRTFVLASFTIQLFLIVFAPFRKRSSSYVIVASTWLSYLLADWVAAQAVGLITRASEISDADSDLFALWAQFLLLHLGGPDTISALALEDNALWLRTGLHLGTQAYSTLGILVRSVRRSRMWAPMVLVFVVGVIKYVERIMSLFHGRMMEDEDLRYYADELSRDTGAEALTPVDMVRGGFNLFHSYKMLYADTSLHPEVRKAARLYFNRRSSEEAYRIVEAQLNFMYEATYTKASVTNKKAWRIFRHVVMLLELASLVIWSRYITKSGVYSKQDIRITDTLVIGAVAVDCLALLRFNTSDWNIASMSRDAYWIRIWLCNQVIRARQAGFWKRPREEQSIIWSCFRRLFLARWSESINNPPSVRAASFCAYPNRLLTRHMCVTKTRFTSELWDFIYEALKKPMSEPEFQRLLVNEQLAQALPLHILSFYDVYQHCESIIDAIDQSRRSGSADNDIDRYRRVHRVISEYILYLHMYQPEMLFGAAGKRHMLDRRRDVKFFQSDPYHVGLWQTEEAPCDPNERNEFGILTWKNEKDENELERAAKEAMENVKRSMTEADEDTKFYQLALMYVHLLCHIAIGCKPDVHLRQLKEGGELLSFVWLLMTHLGVATRTHAPTPTENLEVQLSNYIRRQASEW